MNRTNSRQRQWRRRPGTSTDVPCHPESVVCTDQVDYIVYIVPWPSCPPVVGFRPPKTLYKPLPPPLKYPYPWKGYRFASGKGKGRCKNTRGLPVPITRHLQLGVLNLQVQILSHFPVLVFMSCHIHRLKPIWNGLVHMVEVVLLFCLSPQSSSGRNIESYLSLANGKWKQLSIMNGSGRMTTRRGLFIQLHVRKRFNMLLLLLQKNCLAKTAAIFWPWKHSRTLFTSLVQWIRIISMSTMSIKMTTLLLYLDAAADSGEIIEVSTACWFTHHRLTSFTRTSLTVHWFTIAKGLWLENIQEMTCLGSCIKLSLSNMKKKLRMLVCRISNMPLTLLNLRMSYTHSVRAYKALKDFLPLPNPCTLK